MAVKKYNVLSSLSHNNEDFDKGDTIDLDDKFAKPLLEVKVIEDPKAKSAVADGDK